VPAGADVAVGVFQLRALERPAPRDREDPIFQTGEWGFALGSAYWGSGLFLDAARQVLDFAFDHVGVLRLEARAAVVNGRGNGALRKTGAVQEGVLRRSFHRGGQFHDQVLWSILAEDWRLQRGPQLGSVH
jgi:ribosomal-protein-alanine N-acetyltransferase